ncbi:hypothetical protein LXT21_34005 [Myxococcus sp. K38C18041901]|uniref:hypothetical protein n=1 Tax=Myxococcus guangdongensis TaxID=2906760 RepID=UPI0020A75DDC|nr:hypothetical protein [Myxococcus guangdongensis]MCP3063801.1 hypothetical protein [Myxococcus guangdongensis]
MAASKRWWVMGLLGAWVACLGCGDSTSEDACVGPPPGGVECRTGCSYLCGQQCADVCAAGGCWSCVAGVWSNTAIDCVPACP